MIEAAIAMPVSGPGAVTGGSCDFRSSLAVNVLNRMGSDKTFRTEALNLATADSELNRVDPIGIYKLLVGEATFTDKSSGTVVTEKTLISPDFDGEAIGVWTDAGENGTGSKREYRAILDRARIFAETSGSAAMFWISPAKREKRSDLPEHRAYLWKKNDRGEVTAFSYQLTGSNQALENTLGRLASNASFIDPQTLLWTTNQDAVSHQRIFNTYRSSLSEKEASAIIGFLERFKKDSELPDVKRWSSLEKSKKLYEEKLREVYKGDIQEAIEAISSGFLGLAREVVVESNESTAELVASNKAMLSRSFSDEVRRSDNDDTKAINDLSGEEKAFMIKMFQEDIIKPVVAALIGVVTDDGGHNDAQIIEYSQEGIKDEEQRDDLLTAVMMPVVPMIEGILLQLADQDFDRDEAIIIHPALPEKTEEFITGLIILVLTPPEEIVSLTENFGISESSDTLGTEDSMIPYFSNLSDGTQDNYALRDRALHIGETVNSRYVLRIKPDYKLVENKERRIADVQEILKLICLTWKIDGENEANDEYQEAVVTTADDLLEYFTTDEQVSETSFISRGSLNNIKILLEACRDEETTREMKELVILFLYHELVEIYENKELNDKYSELSVIFAKFEMMFQDPIFRRRYDKFILNIEKLFCPELLIDDGFRNFDIIKLLEFIKAKQFTIERLPDLQNINPKKTFTWFPPTGIIYQYLYQVVPSEL
ncbi:hypothetical protein A3D03_02615 [Candidatus Gottesmanbacteria bacterium RIFCSPHIGHO2_02_FULL_40_13]|uniref:Uncharacterized protein n=1 Tax=Candidatus Gottesmanbacteria bacterium RIFCSPHIGHO2_02_FULL_40_13 TaxID=1798384 RepID=A0A1F6ABL8_9BACT|nr:MAG: hypothetical protein A3D03_02615 [Candidatus Gottesmanbacteria bacterium RIFCSPHIGHO2_02_FULL_40_13]